MRHVKPLEAFLVQIAIAFNQIRTCTVKYSEILSMPSVTLPTGQETNVRAWTEQLDYQNRGTASELITETQQAKHERTGILRHRAINKLH